MATTNNANESVNLVAKIKRVAIREIVDSSTGDVQRRVRLVLDTVFDGIVKDNDKYVAGKVDYIDYTLSGYVYNVCNANDDIAAVLSYMFNVSTETGVSSLPISKSSLWLAGATVTIDRTPFKAGDTYVDENGNTVEYSYNGYRKTMLEIQLSERGQKMLDKQLDAMA